MVALRGRRRALSMAPVMRAAITPLMTTPLITQPFTQATATPNSTTNRAVM